MISPDSPFLFLISPGSMYSWRPRPLWMIRPLFFRDVALRACEYQAGRKFQLCLCRDIFAELMVAGCRVSMRESRILRMNGFENQHNSMRHLSKIKTSKEFTRTIASDCTFKNAFASSREQSVGPPRRPFRTSAAPPAALALSSQSARPLPLRT